MGLRYSRNLEKSIQDYLIAELTSDGWNGVTVNLNLTKGVKDFPYIDIILADETDDIMEIGGGRFLKYPIITLRLFAKGEAQREDLANWMLEKLEDNIPYYTYILGSGNIWQKTLAGNIVIRQIMRNERELSNSDPQILEEEDRYRHNLTFKVFIGEI